MSEHGPTPRKPMTGRERAAKHRALMHARGLRLKQFWLPDTSDPKWREEARQESARIAASETEDDKAFFASLIDWEKLPPY
jgi:hypothetical protein